MGNLYGKKVTLLKDCKLLDSLQSFLCICGIHLIWCTKWTSWDCGDILYSCVSKVFGWKNDYTDNIYLRKYFYEKYIFEKYIFHKILYIKKYTKYKSEFVMMCFRLKNGDEIGLWKKRKGWEMGLDWFRGNGKSLYVGVAERVPELTQMDYRGDFVIGCIGLDGLELVWLPHGTYCSIMNTSLWATSSPISLMILLAVSRLASTYFQR